MGEAGHGFVGDQKLRLCRHGAGELELAHLDLGQFTRQPLRLALEPDLAQKLETTRRNIPGVKRGAARRDRVEERHAQIVRET
jgi:hypothetical protein